MSEFEYHSIYKKYDMRGEISIGTGTVKVHNIFDLMPAFMRDADIVFCDTPGNGGALKSYYAKANISYEGVRYDAFAERLLNVIEEINPRIVFLEVFKGNRQRFEDAFRDRYSNVKVFDSMYYKKPQNKCWIIMASNAALPSVDFSGQDEEKIIERICNEIDFRCIADPCMGKGLVGYYADKAGKKFVGTELNYKRLAVLLERINTHRRGSIS